MQKRIATILEREGEEVTLKKLTGVSRNRTTLQNTLTYTDYTVNAHIRLYTPQELGGLVSEGDRQMRIAADAIAVVPEKNDRVVINSQQFNVISVDRRTAHAENALYILQIRGDE